MIRGISVKMRWIVYICTQNLTVKDKFLTVTLTANRRLLPVGQHTQEYQSPWQEVPPLQQELFQEVHL